MFNTSRLVPVAGRSEEWLACDAAQQADAPIITRGERVSNGGTMGAGRAGRRALLTLGSVNVSSPHRIRCRGMRNYTLLLALTCAGSLTAARTASVAQAPGQPYVPRQSDRPAPLEGDEPGYRTIFDGQTLAGWDGDPKYWRVENGSLVGEITPDTVIKSNTFIVWRLGRPRDFDLKLEYRITPEGNSGINYRSAVVPDPITPGNRFAMRGYQFDIDGRKRYAGNTYEEKGRLFLALRGQLTRVVGGRPPVLVSTFADSEGLAAVIDEGWNSAQVIARGATLTHVLNGRLMCVVVDDDVENRPADGLIGLQVHVGPPMRVEYRHIRLKDR
jgi:hypothetical protein